MSNKRKEQEESQHTSSSGDDSDSELPENVDVDFDFYNPKEVDYHGLKRLLGQLFSSDAELLHLGDIVDIIIGESHVGTTVKVDGETSDPYAILSIINVMQNKDKEGIQSLIKYLLNKCPKRLEDTVGEILSLESDKAVGWIVSDRFINMPVEVMPPMYMTLHQEMQDAITQGDPYKFEWYMFISKTYKEVESTLDEQEEAERDTQASQPKKKKAKQSPATVTETFYFQQEDETIAKYATHHFDFKFTNIDKEAASDAKRVFSDTGIEPSRRLLLVHHSKFADLVNEIDQTWSTTATKQ